MSKPVVRVIFAVLIGLGIIALAFSNVQASLGSMFQKTDVNNANSAAFSGDEVLGRASFGARPSTTFYQFESMDPGSGHDCESESNPSLDG